MKRLLAAVGVLLVLSVLTVACDTSQPLDSGPANYEVHLSAVNVVGFIGGEGIKSFRVWEMFEDNDGNGLPDDTDGDGVPELYNFCRTLLISDTTHINPGSVPWSFTVQISVIPAGATEEVVLTSAGALADDPTINLTSYDTSAQSLIFGAIQPTVSIGTGVDMRTFRFRNPQKMSQANDHVARSVFNPLSDFDPATYGLGNGLCSLFDPGPSVTDGQSPFSVELSAGDTIIVRALRGALPPMGIDTFNREGQLSGALTQAGAGVTVIGTVTGDPITGSGFSFSFTAR